MISSLRIDSIAEKKRKAFKTNDVSEAIIKANIGLIISTPLLQQTIFVRESSFLLKRKSYHLFVRIKVCLLVNKVYDDDTYMHLKRGIYSKPR